MKVNIALLIEHAINSIDSLNQGIRFTSEEQTFLCKNFECIKIRKNEFSIKTGNFENYLYFIEEGILRYWSSGNKKAVDKEITFWFSFPGEFANSYFSLKSQQPSVINIQALTDCIIWRLPKHKLADLYDSSLNANKAARIILENILLRKINREIQLVGFSSEEMYNKLFTKEKEFIEKIPLKYIASYIGVTPQTLSVIRKKILDKAKTPEEGALDRP